MKGRGIEREGLEGDLLVTFDIDVPTKVTDEQREAFEALAAAFPENPRESGGDADGERRTGALSSPSPPSSPACTADAAIYERKGLIEPARTEGRSRRYSEPTSRCSAASRSSPTKVSDSQACGASSSWKHGSARSSDELDDARNASAHGSDGRVPPQLAA